MNNENDNDVEADDFVFVIRSDGSLKSLTIPEQLMDDPPEEVQLVLSLFGIFDINSVIDRTLH